ncbi:hypothetical protein [Cognatishimia activa]|uniref:Uncharacterized protein n=1 Tax=Cognatishimia activa TaxID=1715691 RepID=A0A0P1ILH9_9RHOB|nr:hypothetical protein [Cognatishimia activa]CUI37896.1 hypothetical protein TA5113_00328 [Cognatishimia activa]CUK24482.1 hypothetical protein TA5114_00266 [Cognatishimia activa]
MTQTLSALMVIFAISATLSLTWVSAGYAHTANQRYETMEMLMGYSVERPQPATLVHAVNDQADLPVPAVASVNWIKPVQ